MFGGDDSLWSILIGLSQWAIRLGALVYVPFRRSPDAAKGWLLLFFFLPWPALVIYWFIGRARHPKWRRERVKALPDIVRNAMGRAGSSLEKHFYDLPAKLDDTGNLARVIGQFPPVAGNAVELEPDYDRVIARLAGDIDRARHHVHLMFYIFMDDEAGEQILSPLERAAARGVECRLMIDAVGSSTSCRAIAKRLEGSGVELKAILPIGLIGRVSRADLRNHRKIAVIDGTIGWVGSQNVINRDSEAVKPNRELMVRALGPIVTQLQIVFIGDWYLETEQELKAPELFPVPDENADGAPAQIVAGGPDHPRAGMDMLFAELLQAAQHRIVLTTPYFIPSEGLSLALKAAALRGLAVHLIVSEVNDSRVVDLAQGSYFGELLEAGVRISRCRTNFLHAKHISVDDDVALIGSSNIDIRSFELNSEVAMIIYHPGTARHLHRLEEEYLAGSREIHAEDWRNRSLFVKVAGNIARLFSPLL